MILKKGPPLGTAELMKGYVQSLWCGELRDLLCAHLGDWWSGTKIHLLNPLLSRAQFLSFAINYGLSDKVLPHGNRRVRTWQSRVHAHSVLLASSLLFTSLFWGEGLGLNSACLWRVKDKMNCPWKLVKVRNRETLLRHMKYTYLFPLLLYCVWKVSSWSLMEWKESWSS